MQDDSRKVLRAGVRFVIAVSPDDVGRRVSLRRRVPDGKFSDAVGVLEAWSEEIIQVRRKDGSLVEFPAEALVAGKVVPERPTRAT